MAHYFTPESNVIKAAAVLTEDERGLLEDVFRYYHADDYLSAESSSFDVGTRGCELMTSLWHKRLITSGVSWMANPYAVVPTSLAYALYTLNNWTDFEPRNAWDADLADRAQLPLFVTAGVEGDNE